MRMSWTLSMLQEQMIIDTARRDSGSLARLRLQGNGDWNLESGADQLGPSRLSPRHVWYLARSCHHEGRGVRPVMTRTGHEPFEPGFTWPAGVH
jgi:hypothetical protein